MSSSVHAAADPSAAIQLSSDNKRFLRRLTAIATLGGLLFGFDTGVISGALLYIRDDLGMSSFQEGLVVTALLFPGAASGALLGGPIADRLGRKKTLILCAVTFIVGALGCALSPGITLLIVFRVILGFGVGCASVACPVYLAEMAPADRRSRMVTINELMIVSGLFIAFSSNWILDRFVGHQEVWRWMIGIAVVPAVALFIGMMFLPESPRWYALKGRLEESRQTLLLGRDAATADAELAQMVTVLESDKNKNGLSEVIRALRENRWMRRILLIGVVWGIAFLVPGQNVVNYYAPSVLTDAGMGNSAALLSSMTVGLVQIFATVAGIWLLSFVPIRKMMITGYSLFIVFHALLAITFALPETTGRAYMIVALMIGINASLSCLVGTSGWLLLSEIFPIAIRGIAIGLAVSVHWCANALISFLFPIVVDEFGIVSTFVGFLVINLVALVFVIKFIPETHGRTLEELEEEIRIAGSR